MLRCASPSGGSGVQPQCATPVRPPNQQQQQQEDEEEDDDDDDDDDDDETERDPEIGGGSEQVLSRYEQQRAANIKRNQRFAFGLGLSLASPSSSAAASHRGSSGGGGGGRSGGGGSSGGGEMKLAISHLQDLAECSEAEAKEAWNRHGRAADLTEAAHWLVTKKQQLPSTQLPRAPSQRSAARVAATTLSKSPPTGRKPPSAPLAKGTRIEADFCGEGTYYAGVIRKLCRLPPAVGRHKNVLRYCIDYDDGDQEESVIRSRIRLLSAGSAGPSGEKAEGASEGGAGDEREQRDDEGGTPLSYTTLRNWGWSLVQGSGLESWRWLAPGIPGVRGYTEGVHWFSGMRAVAKHLGFKAYSQHGQVHVTTDPDWAILTGLGVRTRQSRATTAAPKRGSASQSNVRNVSGGRGDKRRRTEGPSSSGGGGGTSRCGTNRRGATKSQPKPAPRADDHLSLEIVDDDANDDLRVHLIEAVRRTCEESASDLPSPKEICDALNGKAHSSSAVTQQACNQFGRGWCCVACQSEEGFQFHAEQVDRGTFMRLNVSRGGPTYAYVFWRVDLTAL
jgi:hypothetical protein